MAHDAAAAARFFDECKDEALPQDKVLAMAEFVARHHREGRRVVVLTSGGTVRRRQPRPSER